ncbi:MAG: formylmethanofuran--tetrahydromethanopterin N-formyltransferase, partial [Bacillota bacterium]
GIVRSGSKTESKYSFLSASTNTKFCPTIKRQVESNLDIEVNSVLEVVIDGLSAGAIKEAMKKGIEAACGQGITRITAGNYGGKLGSHEFHLHRILRGEEL